MTRFLRQPRFSVLDLAAFGAGVGTAWAGLRRWEDWRTSRYAGFEAFVPSGDGVSRAKLELAGVRPGEVVYDLGSGDGATLMLAAREFGATAVGIEVRPELVRLTRSRVRRAGLRGRVHVRREDFTTAAVGDADVVMAYLTTGTLEQVRPALERGLRPGARVVTHDFPVPGWVPAAEEPWSGGDEAAHLYLYVIGNGAPL